MPRYRKWLYIRCPSCGQETVHRLLGLRRIAYTDLPSIYYECVKCGYKQIARQELAMAEVAGV